MRLAVQSQPWEIVYETLSRKCPSQIRAGVGWEFKPQYCKNINT
jgi:hypothetical protein